MSLIPYDKGFNFEEYATDHPSATFPPADLDSELDNIETAIDSTQTDLALIQRDDGALRNNIVTPDSLSPATIALIASTLTPRGDWLTGTNYVVRDIVSQSGNTYICLAAHTAGTFNTDLAAAKWMVFSYNQSADAELAAIAGLSSAADRGIHFTGSGTAALHTQTAFARQFLAESTRLNARIRLGAEELAVQNQILNGSFNHVRDSSVTSHNPSASAASYLFHRWYAFQNGGITGHMTVSRQAGPSADGSLSSADKSRYPYCARVLRDVSASFTDGRFKTVLSTSLSRPLIGKALTIKFYARKGSGYSAASSQVSVILQGGTGTDQSATDVESVSWTGQSTILNQAVTLTTSWQEFTVTTVTVVDTFTQLAFGFHATFGTAVVNDYFEVAGVRVAATGAISDVPIEDTPVDVDFIRCTRFFECISASGVSSHQIACGYFATTTSVIASLSFQGKRSVPAITVSGASDFTVENAAANDAATAIAFTSGAIGLDRARMVLTIGSGRTAGQGCNIVATDADARIYIDAEFA